MSKALLVAFWVVKWVSMIAICDIMMAEVESFFTQHGLTEPWAFILAVCIITMLLATNYVATYTLDAERDRQQ
jgi:hypothetical protein